MNARKLAVVGVPLLLLGVIALMFFSDPDVGMGDGESETISAAGDVEKVDVEPEVGVAGSTGEVREGTLGRENLEDADAKYLAALSGFKGRIVDHERKPCADRIVRFYRLDAEILQNPGLFAEGSDEFAPTVEIHEGKSDDEGRFLVTGAWPYSIYILEADAEGDDRLTRVIDRSPGTGEIIDLGDIQLIQLGVIVGRVVDEDGEGVPGAMVRASDIPAALVTMAPVERFDPEGAVVVREGDVPFLVEMPGFVKRYFDILMKPRTMTRDDGTFRIPGVQPRENVLAINKKTFVPLVKTGVKVGAGKEKDAGDIRLRTGEEAFVKVVDSDKEPVPGAEIIIGATTPMFGVDMASRAGSTDARGELYVTGWPAGKITVAARRSRSHPWVLVQPANVAGDIVVVLPGRYHLDLTVTSTLGKDIVGPKFKLLPSPDEGMPLDVGALGFVSWLDIQRNVKRLEDGRFRVSDLIPGKYTLAVVADGHAAARVDFKIDKSATAAVKLRPESPFVVRVVDSAGVPVRRSKVYVLTERPDSGRQLMEMPIVAGETDRDGELRVRDGEAGLVRLSASHPAFGYAHAEVKLPTPDPVVLHMEAPGQIAGVLTENGRAPTPAKWTVVIEPRRSRSRKERGAMPEMPKFTVPDLEGNFEVIGLMPGRYRLRVMKSLTALTSPGGMIGFMMRAEMMQEDVTEEVVVEAGKSEFVRIEAIKEPKQVDGPSARVSGTILVNGRAGAGLMVTGRRGRGVGVTSDDRGHFDLGQVAVGDLQLAVRDLSSANIMDMRMESHLWQKRLEIEAGKDILLDVQIRTGSLSGSVLTPTGAPAKGLRVKAVGRKTTGPEMGSTSTSFTSTDEQGRFEFPSLAAATYRVEVKERQGHGVIGPIDLQASGVVRDATIRLTGVFTVTGTVDLSSFDGKRPNWCYLQFGTNAGSRTSGVSVRRNGTFRARNLAPGDYQVRLFVPGENNGSRELVVTPTVVVRDKDLSGVVLVPGAAVPAPNIKVSPSGQRPLRGGGARGGGPGGGRAPGRRD